MSKLSHYLAKYIKPDQLDGENREAKLEKQIRDGIKAYKKEKRTESNFWHWGR